MKVQCRIIDSISGKMKDIQIKSENDTVDTEVPVTAEDCGKLIIKAFKTNKQLCRSFFEDMLKLKLAFPTKDNQNKFIVGMGMERVLTENLNMFLSKDVMCLCSRNEKRNDVTLYKKFPFSVKYSTPAKTGAFSPVRMINIRSGDKDKEYIVHEDTLIIIPGKKCPEDKVIDPESGKNFKRTSKKGQSILLKYTNETLTLCAKQKYGSKLIYIPKEKIEKGSLRITNDGIDLKGSFISSFVNDVNNEFYVFHMMDEIEIENIEELDIIRIGVEIALGRKLNYV